MSAFLFKFNKQCKSESEFKYVHSIKYYVTLFIAIRRHVENAKIEDLNR